MSTNETSNVMIFEPFSASERVGAIVLASFALLSALAVGFIVLRTIRLGTAVFLRHEDTTSRPPEILFFRTQLGHYGACLIFSNLFISIAGLINFGWVSPAALRQGSACVAQVVLRQIGIWSTCWFTATLGVHTLVSFVFHVCPARWRSLLVIALGWVIAFVAALVPLQKDDAYGPTNSSCGVTRSHPIDIFALEAFPVILATVVSIVVYSVTFLVLHGKLSIGVHNFNQGEEVSEEYHEFISTIIFTMFWFPLAFVLLLLPFSVTRIITYAGQSVPSAPGVFADACVSLLGFVNVCLLYNTFRVIDPVYRERRTDKLAVDTMKTFGNDASGESPIVPPNSQRTSMWSQETSPEMYSRTNTSSNHHSRNFSLASVDSSTELLRKEKVLYETVWTEVVPPALNGISPTRVSGRLSGDAPIRSTTMDARFLTSYVTRDAQTGLSKHAHPFSLLAGANAPGKEERELIFKSKAPPALNLPPFPYLPGPFPPTEEEPAIEVNTWNHEDVDLASALSFSDDDSGVITHTAKVWPLPQLPELSEDEQDDFLSYQPSMRARSQRTTMTTVWSQETGDSLSSPDTAAREMYPGPVANLLSHGAMLGDKADVGAVVSRLTPSGSLRAVKVASRLTARVSEMLGPKSPGIKDFRIVLAPNDSSV